MIWGFYVCLFVFVWGGVFFWFCFYFFICSGVLLLLVFLSYYCDTLRFAADSFRNKTLSTRSHSYSHSVCILGDTVLSGYPWSCSGLRRKCSNMQMSECDERMVEKHDSRLRAAEEEVDLIN